MPTDICIVIFRPRDEARARVRVNLIDGLIEQFADLWMKKNKLVGPSKSLVKHEPEIWLRLRKILFHFRRDFRPTRSKSWSTRDIILSRIPMMSIRFSDSSLSSHFIRHLINSSKFSFPDLIQFPCSGDGTVFDFHTGGIRFNRKTKHRACVERSVRSH